MGKRPSLYNEEKALRLMGQRPSECVAIFPLEGDISLGIWRILLPLSPAWWCGQSNRPRKENRPLMTAVHSGDHHTADNYYLALMWCQKRASPVPNQDEAAWECSGGEAAVALET